ncbi:MAG: caspase family protein [Chloroflexota bacterium]|nr:caspase family protein [Chloroflexota bacterium]
MCVGINYVGAAPGIPALQYAEADARSMADLLGQRGFTVTLLQGPAATRRAIVAALATLAAGPADLFVLYLSGHGLHGDSLLDEGRVYYAPFDFDPTDTMVALPMLDLATAFEGRVRAYNAFALFDCCYAGVVAGTPINTNWTAAGTRWGQEITSGESAMRDAVLHKLTPADGNAAVGSRALVAACPGNVPARELDSLRHGVATYYALEGWRGKAADPETGHITDSGLYTYVNAQLNAHHQPPLARSAQISDILLDQIPPAREALRTILGPPTPTPTWPPDCQVIDGAAIATAQAEAVFPGADSMYARPGQAAFWQIVAGQDVRRDLTDRLLAAIKAVGDTPGMHFQLITSAEGNGKSTLLLRLEYELAQAGEYVLIPNHDGATLDASALRTACAVAATDVDRPGRRVFLLLDNAYRFNTPLLTTLATFRIANLTILATARYTDLTTDVLLPAPSLPLDPTQLGPPTFAAVDLPSLNAREAAALIDKIRAAKMLQSSDPAAVITAAQGADGIPLLLAVLRLTNRDGIAGYVRRRLIEINNGRDPAAEEPSHWEPFMRVYYAVAVCRACGVYTPQVLLPAISGLPPGQVNALLCSDANGGQTGMAREFLRGECGGTWRTDHQIIAVAVLRRLAGLEPLHSSLPDLLDHLASAPTSDLPQAACLVGAILLHFAADPGLLLGVVDDNALVAPPLLGVTDLPSESPDGPSQDRAAVNAMLDSPAFAPALARLRAAASPTDLVASWAPAAIQVWRWQEAVTMLTTALATGTLTAADTARAHFLRGLAAGRLGQHAAAVADYTQALTALPDDATILRRRALSYLQLDQPAAALADYSRALTVHADDPLLWTQRAVTFTAMRRYPDALADLSHALTLRPAFPLALLQQARAQALAGNAPAAQATLQQLHAADPTATAPLAADPLLGPLLPP